MPDSRFIKYKNKSIHYRVFGQGKPVVLLHGIPVTNTVWEETALSLKKDFLVITPDIPGTGQSEMLDGNISIEDFADVVKEIIDVETSKAPASGIILIGHSMGGYITLAFAEKYPELLNGFGLFHSTAYADDEEKKQTRRKAIEFIKANGAYAFLKTSTPNLFADKKHPKIEEIIEEGRNFNSEALIQYYEAMIKRPDRTAVLKNTKKPVLFIMGEKDSVVPLQAALQQCHMPAISHIHIMENAGHMGMIEESVTSGGIIRAFLQNI